MRFTLLIDTPDRAGLIYEIASIILEMGFNIEKNDEFVDSHHKHFFMRTIINHNENIAADEISARLKRALPNHSRIDIFTDSKPSIVALCTKEAHCLGDMLIKHHSGEFEIKAVISNHTILEPLVRKFEIPYIHIPHTSAESNDRIIQKCRELNPTLIVLAKYMQLLPPQFTAIFGSKTINIHHSFLPAFIGANPYKQAFERGVKIIGATAHFINDELDSGAIITQDIMQVNHTFSWQDMQKAGQNIERIVLGRAIDLALKHRIFVFQNKTIVF